MNKRVPKWLRPAQGFTNEGWILPDGQFAVAYRPDEGPEHGLVAKFILGEHGEVKAEEAGWLRISDYGNRCTMPLTQRQQNTLFDYCQFHGCDYEEVLQDVKLLTVQPVRAHAGQGKETQP